VCYTSAYCGVLSVLIDGRATAAFAYPGKQRDDWQRAWPQSSAIERAANAVGSTSIDGSISSFLSQ